MPQSRIGSLRIVRLREICGRLEEQIGLLEAARKFLENDETPQPEIINRVAGVLAEKAVRRRQ